MPRVTLSKSISRAAFGACTGGWLRCRAGRIGRFTSLSFRVSRLPHNRSRHLAGPGLGRSMERCSGVGDPRWGQAVATLGCGAGLRLRGSRPGRRFAHQHSPLRMASVKNLAEAGETGVGLSRAGSLRRAADPARSRSGCRRPARSRPGGWSPSPPPACGRSRGPSPEPENAYSPGFCRRRNGSKRVAMDCGGMPRPVSRTENSMRRATVWRATTSTNPSAVNLRALVVRLSSTRLSATGCPIRKSASGSGEPARSGSSPPRSAGRCPAPIRGCR